MADSSLDDFFAKKDKKGQKKKPKNKITMGGSMGVTTSDVSSTSTASSSAPTNSSSSSTKKTTTKKNKNEKQQGSSGMEDQEWHDYEPETEKDYSGLRIQNLQIKSEEDDDVENDYNNENDENNETGERQHSNTGPWNKSGQRSSTPTPPVVKEEPAPVVEETPSKSSGRYVPPGQRGMGGGSSMTPTEARMARIRNSKKEAPNINCELDFPTLGGAANDYDPKGFERVHSGNRNLEDPSNHNLQLKLNNKYRALQD